MTNANIFCQQFRNYSYNIVHLYDHKNVRKKKHSLKKSFYLVSIGTRTSLQILNEKRKEKLYIFPIIKKSKKEPKNLKNRQSGQDTQSLF